MGAAAEWAVAAYAALAAALFLYRRSPAMVAWLGDEAAIVIAGGWWLAGASVALAATAPAGELARAAGSASVPATASPAWPPSAFRPPFWPGRYAGPGARTSTWPPCSR